MQFVLPAKTDATKEGAAVYLSRLTMRLLPEWISRAGIKEGLVFVRMLGVIAELRIRRSEPECQ
jgi:hypothetical protein